MFGYNGQRGYLNYFALLPKIQKRAYCKQLLTFGEIALIEKRFVKLTLQIRNDNPKAINFCTELGYKEDSVFSFL